MKRILLTTVVGLTGLACQPGENISDSSLNAGSREISSTISHDQAHLGSGYNVDEEEFAGDCITYNVTYAGNRQSYLKFDRSMTQEELEKSFGFSAEGKAKFGMTEVSAAADFAKSTASSAYTESITYMKRIELANAKLEYTGLSPRGSTIQANEGSTLTNEERWTKTCGHEYVDQVTLGGALYFNFRIEFASKEAKQAFNASFGVSSPMYSASGSLSSALAEFGKSASIKLSAYQIGGDVTRLGKLFTVLDSDGKTSYAISECSMENLAKCNDAITAALAYADEFGDQFKGGQYDNTTPDGPAVLSYITKDWSNLAFHPMNPVAGPLVKQKRKKILALLDTNVRYGTRLISLLYGKLRLTPNQLQKLKEIEKEIADNNVALSNAAYACWDGDLLTCPEVAATELASFVAHQPEQFEVEPESFAQFCDIAHLPAHRLSLKHTIDQLLAIAEADLSQFGWDKCGEAEKELIDNPLLRTVDLTGKGIRVIEPLAKLPTIRVLNLANNSISDISALADLKDLEELYIGDNPISDISVIGQFPNLKKLSVRSIDATDGSVIEQKPDLISLDIAYSKITDLSFVNRMPRLRELKAQGADDVNAIAVASETMDLLYLTEDQACEGEREWARSQGQMIESDYKYFVDKNWAPVYLTPGLRSSTNEFAECPIASKTL